MTSKQNSIQKMSLSTVVYLVPCTVQIALIPNFSALLTTVQSLNTQLQVAQELQEFNKSGFAENKNLVRLSLINLAIDVVRRVVVYATNTSNTVLRAEMNYTESGLKRSSDMDLKAQCLVIYDRANTNATVLASYGITAVMLAGLQTAITNFITAIPKVRVGGTDTNQSTQQIEFLFQSLADTYTKMDVGVEMLKISQPNFYNEYKKVRKIINTSPLSLALKAQAQDAMTGEALANVTFRFVPAGNILKSGSTGGAKPLVKKTATKGGLKQRNMAEGAYHVVISKLGYKDKTETVNIINGETTMVEVMLDKG